MTIRSKKQLKNLFEPVIFDEVKMPTGVYKRTDFHRKKKSLRLNNYELLVPHLKNINKSLQQISKILKLGQDWYLVDFYFHNKGKKLIIDEFRIRKA